MQVLSGTGRVLGGEVGHDGVRIGQTLCGDPADHSQGPADAELSHDLLQVTPHGVTGEQSCEWSSPGCECVVEHAATPLQRGHDLRHLGDSRASAIQDAQGDGLMLPQPSADGGGLQVRHRRLLHAVKGAWQ